MVFLITLILARPLMETLRMRWTRLSFEKSLVTFCLSQNDMYSRYGSGYLSKELRISPVDKMSFTRAKSPLRGQKDSFADKKSL